MQRSTQPLSNIVQPRTMESDLDDDHDGNRRDLADMFQKTSQDLTGGRAMQENRTISDLSTFHLGPQTSQGTASFGPYTASSPGVKQPKAQGPVGSSAYSPTPPYIAPPPPPMPKMAPPPMMTPPPMSVPLPPDWAPKWPDLLDSHPKMQSAKEPGSDNHQDAAGDVENADSKEASTNHGKARSQIAATTNDDDEIQQDQASASGADAPNLASVLSRTATEYLGLDLLGDDPQSQFFAHLLNDIERLQAQVRVLNLRLHRALQPPSFKPSTSMERPVEDLKPRMQVLHRVYADLSNNNSSSNIGTYTDQPQLVEVLGHYKKWVLQGKEPIFDLESYLRGHPDVCLVVFREYGDEKPRARPEERYAWGPHGTELQGNWPSSRKERMLITGEVFQQAVRSVGTCDLNETPTDEIEAPYLYFYQHRAELKKLKDDENKDVREPAQLLWSYLDEHYAAEYQEADELIGRGFITPLHLAKLYKPNDMVITLRNHMPEALMISTWPKESNENQITFKAWNWKFSGITFWRETRTRQEDIPAGIAQTQEMPINDLRYIPRRFVSESIMRNLLARGRKYWDMRKRTFVSYSGLDAWHEDRYDNARIMIDTETHHRMAGGSGAKFDPASQAMPLHMQPAKAMVDSMPESLEVDDQMPEQGFLLLPSTVNGFDFQNKRWIKLLVNRIGPLEWNKRAFERLVLDKKSKDMIKALISIHVQSDRKNMHDIIRNKGNGLIILLHGSPGTGKTLTAESVAELAEKPLYSISCGDIGTDAAEVEKHLRTVLYLGKIWNCVLLLDEADVFLEERAIADLHRNSLVSVFLRSLEYYDGILILTSNRVGTFDEAFKSRIQVALHYKPLTKASRKKIWQNFFEILEESGGDVNMSELEDRLEELAAEEMNGRQIRSALHTARQIAVYRKETLDWEILQDVIKTATDFGKYLKKVHGHGDEEWAREDGRR